MGLLDGRAGRLNTKNGGFRPGQCLSALAAVAVIMNAMIMGLVLPTAAELIGEDAGQNIGERMQKGWLWVVVVVMEHGVLLARLVVWWAIPSEPLWLEAVRLRRKLYLAHLGHCHHQHNQGTQGEATTQMKAVGELREAPRVRPDDMEMAHNAPDGTLAETGDRAPWNDRLEAMLENDVGDDSLAVETTSHVDEARPGAFLTQEAVEETEV
jgi:hypothetical protein